MSTTDGNNSSMAFMDERMTEETNKKKKLPRGIRRLPDGRFTLYATRRGRPLRVIVTWRLLGDLNVPVPATRLRHPGMELAQRALVKLRSKILDEERFGVIEATTNARASARVRIGELLPLVAEEYQQKGRKSWSHVEGRWVNHLGPHFAEIVASELTTDEIKAYIASRSRKGASGGTINRELAVVRHMLNLGMGTTPPKVQSVPRFPQQAERPPRSGFLEQSEYDALRPHAKELWLRTLLAIAYTYGVRKSEMLLGMRAHSVSLADNTIDLSGTATKNGEPRLLVMTEEVRTLVAACIQGKRADDFLFTRPNGQPVRDIREAWATRFTDAGVEPRLLHDLRRSAARNMIRAGIDRDTVKKIGGWKTDAVFSRYNIQDTNDLIAAAKKIEERADAARRRVTPQTDSKTDNSHSVTLEIVRTLQ